MGHFRTKMVTFWSPPYVTTKVCKVLSGYRVLLDIIARVQEVYEKWSHACDHFGVTYVTTFRTLFVTLSENGKKTRSKACQKTQENGHFWSLFWSQNVWPLWCERYHLGYRVLLGVFNVCANSRRKVTRVFGHVARNNWSTFRRLFAIFTIFKKLSLKKWRKKQKKGHFWLKNVVPKSDHFCANYATLATTLSWVFATCVQIVDEKWSHLVTCCCHDMANSCTHFSHSFCTPLQNMQKRASQKVTFNKKMVTKRSFSGFSNVWLCICARSSLRDNAILGVFKVCARDGRKCTHGFDHFWWHIVVTFCALFVHFVFFTETAARSSLRSKKHAHKKGNMPKMVIFSDLCFSVWPLLCTFCHADYFAILLKYRNVAKRGRKVTLLHTFFRHFYAKKHVKKVTFFVFFLCTFFCLCDIEPPFLKKNSQKKGYIENTKKTRVFSSTICTKDQNPQRKHARQNDKKRKKVVTRNCHKKAIFKKLRKKTRFFDTFQIVKICQDFHIFYDLEDILTFSLSKKRVFCTFVHFWSLFVLFLPHLWNSPRISGSQSGNFRTQAVTFWSLLVI